MNYSLDVWANWIVVIAYPVLIVFSMVIFVLDKRKAKKNRLRFREFIESQINENIEISSENCMRMLRVSNLNPRQGIAEIADLMGDYKDKNKVVMYLDVIKKLEKIVPFGNLPNELNQIVNRLVEITEESGTASDKHLLIPLQQALDNSKVIERNQNRNRAKNRFIFILTMLGFMASIVSLYISAKSPSKEEMTQIIQEAIKPIK